MSAYVSQSGEKEAVGGERASGGGGQLPDLRDSIVSLLVFHSSGILSLSLSSSSLFLSLSAQVGNHNFYIYFAALRTLYKMTMT